MRRELWTYDICTSAIGDSLDLLHWVVIQVYHLCTQLLCLLQPLRHRVNRIHCIHHRQRTGDRAYPYWSTTHYHRRELLPIPLIQILQEPRRREVASGKDVGHEHEHLFGDILGREHESGVGERYTDVFGLAAIAGVGRYAVAEELAFAAARGLVADTVVAGAAGGVEGHDDLQ